MHCTEEIGWDVYVVVELCSAVVHKYVSRPGEVWDRYILVLYAVNDEYGKSEGNRRIMQDRSTIVREKDESRIGSGFYESKS